MDWLIEVVKTFPAFSETVIVSTITVDTVILYKRAWDRVLSLAEWDACRLDALNVPRRSHVHHMVEGAGRGKAGGADREVERHEPKNSKE